MGCIQERYAFLYQTPGHAFVVDIRSGGIFVKITIIAKTGAKWPMHVNAAFSSFHNFFGAN
jgi:hypothetical protein